MISYSYDLNGNMLSQTDGKGNTITYTYNVANKIIKRIDPGGVGEPAKTESFTYYADGNPKTKTDRNGLTTWYYYDIHGRLIREEVGSSVITYTYDGNGNLLIMTDSTGTTVRTFDEENRVTTKTVPGFGTMTFEYDVTEGQPAGCHAEITTDPMDNVTVKVYDRVGRLSLVTADGRTTTY